MDALVDALVPGMPAEARGGDRRSRHRAIPLFAVETVRSLIDRDVVVPHRRRLPAGRRRRRRCRCRTACTALLAARLDALDPQLRALVADAAVLGSTLPGRGARRRVRARRRRRSRRRSTSCCAARCFDDLAPTRSRRSAGRTASPRTLLRQVAYDTLSRRDRKARHLAVAAHLRATFAGDGDEVIEVVARHYLDALAAVPYDPDSTESVARPSRAHPRRRARDPVGAPRNAADQVRQGGGAPHRLRRHGCSARAGPAVGTRGLRRCGRAAKPMPP